MCRVVSTLKREREREIARVINNYLFVRGIHSLWHDKLGVSKICAIKFTLCSGSSPLDLGKILVCCVYCNCDRQLTCLIV